MTTSVTAEPLSAYIARTGFTETPQAEIARLVTELEAERDRLRTDLALVAQTWDAREAQLRVVVRQLAEMLDV